MFLRKAFHKLCYRIYINGKNYYRNNVDKSIYGLSKISVTRNFTYGENVSLSGEIMILGAGKVSIGDNTMVAAGVIIHTSTHDYGIHPMTEIRIDKDVIIGKHVWIGTGAIINPGVHIADYAVVGSGSVVTKDVAKGAIVAGVPAQVIKFRDLEALGLI